MYALLRAGEPATEVDCISSRLVSGDRPDCHLSLLGAGERSRVVSGADSSAGS